MHLTMMINPSDPTDIQDGIHALERLLGDVTNRPNLAHLVGAVAHSKYGTGRLGYLAAVAEAGDEGASIDTLMRDHFAGSYQSYGGTHASIEKTWRSNGGDAWSARLIHDTPDGERQIMFPSARKLVLSCIDLQRLRGELSSMEAADPDATQ